MQTFRALEPRSAQVAKKTLFSSYGMFLSMDEKKRAGSHAGRRPAVGRGCFSQGSNVPNAQAGRRPARISQEAGVRGEAGQTGRGPGAPRITLAQGGIVSTAPTANASERIMHLGGWG